MTSVLSQRLLEEILLTTIKGFINNIEDNMNLLRRKEYPNKIHNMKNTSDLSLNSSYYQQFNDSDISNIGNYDTPQSGYRSKIDIFVGDNDIKVVERELLRKPFLNNRSIIKRPPYSSVERMHNKISGSTRYNNIWKNKQFQGNSLRENPPTSDSKIFPALPKNAAAKAIIHTAGGTSKKPYREKKFGVMSLSPLRNTIDFKEAPNQYSTQNKNILSRESNLRSPISNFKGENESVIRREKVQFRNDNNANSSVLNSTVYGKDDRFVYIIPEASDITSEDLKVIRINLTDYVKILIPKDFFANANAKLQRMGPYDKIRIAKPSQEMQDQVFRMILERLEEAIPK